VIEIDSNFRLFNPNVNFRVAAGPGAGKTHWLVNHIREVVANGNELAKFGKVACITYTNVGADTVVRRLGAASHRTEVSTVHSFFYKHVVKPYLGFIAADLNIDLSKVSGHDETIVSDYQFLSEWKRASKQTYLFEHEKIVAVLSALIWTLDSNGDVELKVRRRKPGQAPVRNNSLVMYKEMAWARGVIHHDDVMYFSYLLFTRFPFLVTTVASKFPYFFVDEFQDSNSLQVEIFRLLAVEGAYVGIIGDLAQSIYGFNGASPTDFKSFAAPGIVEYVMRQNRRSSNEIIDALNSIRKDITQVPFRNYVGGLPELLIGDMRLAINDVSAKCVGEEIVTLSRRNETVQLVNTGGVPPKHPATLFSQAISQDSNWTRREILISCVKAVVLAREANFPAGLREMLRALRYLYSDEIAERSKVEILLGLLSNFPKYYTEPMSKFANFLSAEYQFKLQGIAFGKPKIFYDHYNFADFAACVKQSEDTGANRTVHKSKGDEFENVLLLTSDSDEIGLLLKPNLLKNEGHRILYVGMSRARNRLFINVPELAPEARKKLSKKFKIVDLA
jgi:DNA helicase-2/ATP-dependent DNA helicase PcrA